MAIQNQGWAYVSGSGATGTPGGSNTQIQFNKAGSLGGDADLTWSGTTVATTNISASVNVSASSFYGDGSNLTGLTASAVNVADGPEQAIQFRVDTPVSGEISGSGALLFLTASSTLSLSSSLAISGTAAGFQSSEVYFGTPAGKIGQLLVEEDDGYLFVLKSSGGIDISGSDGVTTILGEGTNLTVVSSYTNTGLTLTNMADDVAIDIGHDGAISGSSNLAAGGTFTVAGNSTFNGTVNLNAAVTSSDVIVSTTPAGAGPSMQLSASNPAFGPGQVYGQLYFGSGSVGGSGWSGASISLSDFGGGEEFEFRAKNGGTTVRADNGDTTIRATAGEVILSGSAGVLFHTEAVVNAGMNVNNTALTINSSLQNNGISTFNDTATFNNSASVHNAGINVNNARGTFNSGLTVNNASAIFNDSVTLGDASGDGVTLNAGSITQTANQLSWKVISGSAATGSGPTQNGAILFFSSGSEGTRDLLKFHTSGTAPGAVFPQSVYLTQAGSLSGTLGGPGSFLAIDSDNKVVLATPSGGGGGGIFTEINGSNAATTSSVSIGTSGTPQATLYISSSNASSSAAVRKDHSGTTAATLTGLEIDFDKTGASTSNNTMYGLKLDMDNTTATNGVNNMYGLHVTPTLTHAADAGGANLYGALINAQGGTNGSSLITGTRISAQGGTFNYGLQLAVEDGTDNVDLRIESSADSGDFFQIQTTTKGATTLSTVDDGGAEAHLTCSVDGDILLDPAGGKVQVDGNLHINQYIYHRGDADTFINFTDDDINITVGGINMVDFSEGGTDEITFNESAQQLDVRIEGESDPNLFFTDAVNNLVGIGNKTPQAKLHVSASSASGVYFRAEGPDPTATRLLNEPQLVVSGSMVGIGTATPSNSPSTDTFLDVRGHIRVGRSGTGYIFSNNDDNTYLKFGGSGVPGGDGISFFAGSKRMLVIDENPSTADAVIIGSASLETDFAVMTAMSTPNGTGISTAPALYVSGGGDSVGVGTSSPLVSMDIHYTGSGNPINLSNDTGGGELVYFGSSSASLTAGGVYYLNSDGGWASVSSATTGSGHNQLLGISLGTKAKSNGMLIKGYFDVNTFYSGSFTKGAPVYIQSSSAARPVVGGGYLSSSAPTATDSYVRVVGYGTDTPNVVYFNPDSTYVEIG